MLYQAWIFLSGENISDFLKLIICIQIDEYGFYVVTIKSERAVSVKKRVVKWVEALSFNPRENIK